MQLPINFLKFWNKNKSTKKFKKKFKTTCSLEKWILRKKIKFEKKVKKYISFSYICFFIFFSLEDISMYIYITLLVLLAWIKCFLYIFLFCSDLLNVSQIFFNKFFYPTQKNWFFGLNLEKKVYIYFKDGLRCIKISKVIFNLLRQILQKYCNKFYGACTAPLGLILAVYFFSKKENIF